MSRFFGLPCCVRVSIVIQMLIRLHAAIDEELSEDF